MVKIGHARISEYGTIDGKAGDQTKQEVSVTNWYADNWIAVYRPKNPKHAEIIAQKCIDACNNDHIGYSQYTRYSLYNEVCNNNFDIKHLTKNCNADCSALVMTCCRAAGITVPKHMITATMDADLMKTGNFEKFVALKYTAKADLLKRGDILLKVGHTAIVVQTDEAAADNYEVARYFNGKLARTRKTTCTCNMRTGAGIDKPIKKVLPVGTKCFNYGYYNTDKRGVTWYLCVADNVTGYISEKVLRL